ncbi:MAG: triose-phosphate isomerase [Phycisphaerae bacterium]|nr:triose-phosphate isomerase [Phycisphaerae bacterium]
MRRPMVAGNWKMNMTLAGTRELIRGLAAKLSSNAPIDVTVFPPFVYLFAASQAAQDTPIRIGGQNLWPETKGAFTGEVSAEMLREAGCRYVLVGHSERRHTIGGADREGRTVGEDDALLNRKLKAARAAGLTPVLCVGETLAERDAAQTQAVLTSQLEGGLRGQSSAHVAMMLIAYEPVWAIGTGRTATVEQADEAHRHIRAEIARMFDARTAELVRILYGGSVKASNSKELMTPPGVDGVLVGGASLAVDEFLGIISGCFSAKGLG